MAWSCHGSNNAELVKNLRNYGIIKSNRVFMAMNAVDRADFVRSTPYGDHPVSIGYGATISAPHMHAHALEVLEPYCKSGSKVLDIGSGSGYLLACLSHLVGSAGKVVGVDHIEGLVSSSIKNLQKNHSNELNSGRIIVLCGDGRKGCPTEAPFDCIHVGAAVDSEKALHTLLQQLKVNGVLIGPFSSNLGSNLKSGSVVYSSFSPSRDQLFMKFTKTGENEYDREVLFGVRYIPLTDEETQLESEF